MKQTLFTMSLMISLLLASTPALSEEEQFDTSVLQYLQLSETQVQELFSLFIGHAPALLDGSRDNEALMAEIAPRALKLLNSDQRRVLSQLAPQETVEQFGSMSREERSRFMFDSARKLVHPSKQEWIDRMEGMMEE